MKTNPGKLLKQIVTSKGTSIESTEYETFEIDANRCKLDVASIVTPDTVIGYHYKSGQPARTGFYGHIASIHYNAEHQSFLVMVVSGNTVRGQMRGFKVLNGNTNILMNMESLVAFLR